MPSVTRTHQPSRRAQRRDEIRASLLEAIEGLLLEERYTELSVERLAGAAGLSRSTFYVYFEDKGDLLRVLTADVITELIDATRVWWELPPDASKDEVREALGGLFAIYRRHQVLIAAVVETATYDDGVRGEFGAMMNQAAEGVAGHIRNAQEQGYAHRDIDAERVAAWLTWMTERGLFTLVAPGGDASAERMLEAHTEILWNVLYEGTR
jgi:AcrR family transcriptional regulator